MSMVSGWRVVGGSFVSQAFVIGFFTYAVSLLTQPVQESFDASVEMVMYSLTFGTFLSLATTPIVGILIDRISVRRIFVTGILVFALGLWLLAKTETIFQYIVIFGVTMALVNALAGSMISSAVVSRWFTNNRGKALGVAATGTSVGGVLVPGLMTLWLPDYGWRGSLEYLAAVLLIVVVPVVFWCIRNWPQDTKNVEAVAENAPGSVSRAKQLTSKDILANTNFWWLSISLGLLFSTYTAILSNLTPYAAQLGRGNDLASGLIMVVAISGLVGKLLFGAAADIMSHKLALWMAQLLLALGYALLAIAPDYGLVILACMSIGLAAGGMLPVWGALTAEIFGLTSYGRAFGLMGPIIMIFVMVGFPLTGRLYDITGSFALCLWIYTGLMVVAAALLMPLRLPKKAA
jgi:MFS family permease